MGVSLKQRNRGRSRSRHRRAPMSEINVTPFVDVMLVLLIVFMIAAPLLTVGIPLQLPETKAKSLGETPDPMIIEVEDTGRVYIQKRQIADASLETELVAVLAGRAADERIFVRADTGVNYGRVMQVMGLLNGNGFNNIGLVTDSPPRPEPDG